MTEVIRLVKFSNTKVFHDPQDVRVYDNGVLKIMEKDGKVQHLFNRQAWLEVHSEVVD